MFKFARRFPVFLAGYLIFLCIGASMYLSVEEDQETERMKRLQKLRKDFLEEHPCVMAQHLEQVLVDFQRASRKRLTATNGNKSHLYFGESFFFIATVVTTIGYGHVAPLTQSGKIFIILYALVGIPVTLSVLSGFVDRLLVPVSSFLNWLNRKFSGTLQPFTIRFLHFFCIVALSSLVILVLPALFFQYLERNWTFLDSFYYCFLSLTTVGFGDFTPGDSLKFESYRTIYKLVVTLYLFIGIVFMTLTMTVFYNIPQLHLSMLYSLRKSISHEEKELLNITPISTKTSR